ncbi:MAG: NADH-quinone oxidoreductase subunit NuoE [Candidatus Kapabacteria bacterium]|nr:NADH-quinone oxidoreductase subunit NuoE [Candidatus Kapabacteria bacterium]
MGNEFLDSSTEILNFKKDLINKRHHEGSLITLLQSAQDSYGYIPEKVIHYISELVGISAADIYGVITFYSQFRLKPMGHNIIKICEGTACHVNGAKNILTSLQDELNITIDETTDDRLFSLVSVACLGCCALAPVMVINEETYGNLVPDKIKKIIREFKKTITN